MAKSVENSHKILYLDKNEPNYSLNLCFANSWVSLTPFYKSSFESNTIVKGPSLVKDTFISAPKMPF